jgi:hypothetical protein
MFTIVEKSMQIDTTRVFRTISAIMHAALSVFGMSLRGLEMVKALVPMAIKTRG